MKKCCKNYVTFYGDSVEAYCGKCGALHLKDRYELRKKHNISDIALVKLAKDNASKIYSKFSTKFYGKLRSGGYATYTLAHSPSYSLYLLNTRLEVMFYVNIYEIKHSVPSNNFKPVTFRHGNNTVHSFIQLLLYTFVEMTESDFYAYIEQGFESKGITLISKEEYEEAIKPYKEIEEMINRIKVIK